MPLTHKCSLWMAGILTKLPNGFLGYSLTTSTAMASSPPPEVSGTAPRLVIRVPPRPARRMSSRLLEKRKSVCHQVEGNPLSSSLSHDVGNDRDIGVIASTSGQPVTLVRKRKADDEPAGKDRPHSPKRSRTQPALQNALLLRKRARARGVPIARRALPSLPRRTKGTQVPNVGTIHAATSQDNTPTRAGSSELDNHDRTDEMVAVRS